MEKLLTFPNHDQPMNLLIVDDQAFDRSMLCGRLQQVLPPNSIITEAANGKDAIALVTANSHHYDCILLDLHLPDSTGFELTQQILTINKELNIVIITGDADMETALQCLQVGAEDFLIKGEYSNISLYRSIRYAIERHRSREENMMLNEALKREREFSAMQKEFIHLVSHEFRTPITIISGASQILALKAPDLAKNEGAAQFSKIDSAVARLIGLLDNVLRVSQMEEGQVQFTPALFDMQECVAQACDMFTSGRLKWYGGDNKPLYFYGDRQLVEYTLYNVIGNALKYSGDAEVKVVFDAIPAGIQIFVTDQGIGMSPDVLARAGDKFYRGVKSSHIEGTGLGIFLARRFIEHHGGNLMFCSEEGRGTTVRLFLPHNAELSNAA